MFGLLNRIDRMNAGIHHASESVPGLPVHEAVLLRMLLMTGNAVVEEIERILKPHGLSDSDFRTLMMVYTAPGGSTSPSELCGFAQQSPTNMTRITNVLVKQGFVTRASSDEDRRRVELSITPEGRRFVRKLLPTLFPRIHGAFASLSATEQKTLEQLLRKVAANIDQLIGSDSHP
jgi:MarR family transcriptional repressor of emrRAB